MTANEIRKYMDIFEAKSADEVLTGLKTKDPESIQFAQSVGIPPAVIDKFSQIEQELEQIDDEQIIEQVRKIEEVLKSYIEKAKNPNLSRRQLFTAPAKFASFLSNLDTLIQIMKSAPKKSYPAQQTEATWMTDTDISDLLLNRGMKRANEDWFELLSGYHYSDHSEKVKQEYVKEANNFAREFGLNWKFLQVEPQDDEMNWLIKFEDQPDSKDIEITLCIVSPDRYNGYEYEYFTMKPEKFKKIAEIMTSAYDDDDKYSTVTQKFYDKGLEDVAELSIEDGFLPALESAINGTPEQFGDSDIMWGAFGRTKAEAKAALEPESDAEEDWEDDWEDDF